MVLVTSMHPNRIIIAKLANSSTNFLSLGFVKEKKSMVHHIVYFASNFSFN